MGNHSYRIVYRRAGPHGTPPMQARCCSGRGGHAVNGSAGRGRTSRAPGVGTGLQGGAMCGIRGRPHVLQPRARGASESNRDRSRGQRVNVRERPQGHSMFAERRVGGGLGGMGLHFGRVRASAADCRSNIWRVRIEMKIPAEAGIRCGCRNGGLTRARARRKRRWRRRSRPGGRAPARQPVPTRHEGGS